NSSEPGRKRTSTCPGTNSALRPGATAPWPLEVCALEVSGAVKGLNTSRRARRPLRIPFLNFTLNSTASRRRAVGRAPDFFLAAARAWVGPEKLATGYCETERFGRRSFGRPSTTTNAPPPG